MTNFTRFEVIVKKLISASYRRTDTKFASYVHLTSVRQLTDSPLDLPTFQDDRSQNVTSKFWVKRHKS